MVTLIYVKHGGNHKRIKGYLIELKLHMYVILHIERRKGFDLQ